MRCAPATPAGLPLLAPWANRLSSGATAPRVSRSTSTGQPLRSRRQRPADPRLPRREAGLGGRSALDAGDTARVRASIAVDAPAFPFPHRVEVAAVASEPQLRVDTDDRADGSPIGTDRVRLASVPPPSRRSAPPVASAPSAAPASRCSTHGDPHRRPRARSRRGRADRASHLRRRVRAWAATAASRSSTRRSLRRASRCGVGYPFAQVWVPPGQTVRRARADGRPHQRTRRSQGAGRLPRRQRSPPPSRSRSTNPTDRPASPHRTDLSKGAPCRPSSRTTRSSVTPRRWRSWIAAGRSTGGACPASTRVRASPPCSGSRGTGGGCSRRGAGRDDAVGTYVGDTLVLETEHRTADGTVEVTDFMSPGVRRTPRSSGSSRVVSGQVSMQVELIARFDYGSIVPWVSRTGDGLTLVAGDDGAALPQPRRAGGPGPPRSPSSRCGRENGTASRWPGTAHSTTRRCRSTPRPRSAGPRPTGATGLVGAPIRATGTTTSCARSSP